MEQGNYIDATKLVVCHNKRILSHKVFKDIAKRGKSSTGWFFGLKLHAVINHLGQLVVFTITPGNISDANPDMLKKLTARLDGFLYGDAGYISSIAKALKERGLELITKLRENMKPKDLTPEQKYYLQHRGLIESVFNLMKNFCNIEHSRHRSVMNFFVNLWGGLIAYTFLDELPSIPQYVQKLGKEEVALLKNIVFI
jgi:Transposase DDE domain